MKSYILAAAVGVGCFLANSSSFGSDDPPAAKSPPPKTNSSDAKKETDNGFGDLINGLAGQTLKIFLNSDLMKQIPGNTTEEKSENARTLLGMIEGDTFQEKLEVIQALKKLKSDKSVVQPPDEVKKKLKDWYPILEQFAGKDGYINHADVSPIMDSMFDGTIRKVVADVLPGIAARRQALGKKPIFADEQRNLREEGKTKFHRVLDDLGVPDETKDADAGPQKREIWPKVFDQLTENGELSVPKTMDFYRTLSSLPPPPVLKDKVVFKKGLPVAKMKPFLTDGKIPKDLRISLDKKTGKIVIQ